MMTKTKYAIAILLLIFCDGCGYDRFEDLPDTEERSTAESNASLSMLMERYYGDRTVITDDLVLSGMISANDESGNFYRSFVVEDESGAVEVCAGFYDVYRFYPKGHRVTIHARGLALGCYNGVIQLGLKINPWSDYKVEEFESTEILGSYVAVESESKLSAATMTIASFDRAYCGRLVRIENLHVGVDEPSVWAGKNTDGKPLTGMIKFKDSVGDSLYVVTSGYADFAPEEVPETIVSLTGILMCGKFTGSKEVYAIKMRDLSDVEIE